MTDNNRSIGHLAAVVTIMIWGTTFISTKVLLSEFAPLEILLFRFVIGFLVLTVLYPRRLKGTTKRQELTFMLAGLCGVCLYYLLENIALEYTLASNVGVIISVAPCFTAILNHLFVSEEERLRGSFFAGFVIAMAGIFLISYGGSKVRVNPMGDIFALVAAFVWACYSVLIREIGSYGYHTILTTRRVFAYGIIFMIPPAFYSGVHLELERFLMPVNLWNMLFLGVGASALCFVTWNFAVKVLGAVRTSGYIYVVPVITAVTSALVLKEKITIYSGAGIVLTITGLIVSEYRGRMNSPADKTL